MEPRPELITEFPAKRPQLLFPPITYAQAEEVWTKHLSVINQAAIALREDTAIFQAIGYHKVRTEPKDEFLRSLAYYAKVLVEDSLLKVESEYQIYAQTPALTFKHSIGSMLMDARRSVQRLFKTMADLSDAAGWELRLKTPSEDDMVPTACPYQLLYQMICIEKLSSAPAGDAIKRTFLSLQKQARLSLPELPPGIVRVTSDAPCGRPTMLFIAGRLDLSRVVFGANETAWGEFNAVSTITRNARDARLQQYVPLAMAAFEALHQKEKDALAELQNDAAGTSVREDLLWSARSKAIEQMRSDDSFLGGGDEMGIALRPPTWSINQGCYLCQGMMGYQSPKSWNENQRRKYILKFE